MSSTEKPDRPEPGTSEEFAETPGSGNAQRPSPAPSPSRPGRQTPDKEGGAPADEIDLDGDGSRRQ